jgi:hypothetical protein
MWKATIFRGIALVAKGLGLGLVHPKILPASPFFYISGIEAMAATTNKRIVDKANRHSVIGVWRSNPIGSSADTTCAVTTKVSVSKIVIARKRKDDLKRPRVLGIISSCEWLYSNDRCLLLSSANDGEGCCVL